MVVQQHTEHVWLKSSSPKCLIFQPSLLKMLSLLFSVSICLLPSGIMATISLDIPVSKTTEIRHIRASEIRCFKTSQYRNNSKQFNLFNSRKQLKLNYSYVTMYSKKTSRFPFFPPVYITIWDNRKSRYIFNKWNTKLKRLSGKVNIRCLYFEHLWMKFLFILV